MKPFAKTSLIALTSALIGAGTTAGVIKYTENTKHTQNEITEINPFLTELNPFFKEDLFFNQSFSTAGLNTNEISQREDADNIYYEIKVEDPNSTTVNTDVKDGHITISGTTEKKDSSETSQSVFKSTFQQTFPLPENVDQHSMTMFTEKDKVVLKFAKLKA